jgi:hypothetical protein
MISAGEHDPQLCCDTRPTAVLRHTTHSCAATHDPQLCCDTRHPCVLQIEKFDVVWNGGVP